MLSVPCWKWIRCITCSCNNASEPLDYPKSMVPCIIGESHENLMTVNDAVNAVAIAAGTLIRPFLRFVSVLE